MESTTAQERTEITVETDQIVIIRRRRYRRVWCAECRCEVEMLSVVEAEALTGMTQPMPADSAGARGWHVVRSKDKTPLICLESLRKSL